MKKRITFTTWATVASVFNFGSAHAEETVSIEDPHVAREYRLYLKKKAPKAFAYNGQKSYVYFYDAYSEEVARDHALKMCEKQRKKMWQRKNHSPDYVNPCVVINSVNAED